MAKLYTGDMGEREIVKNFIFSQRAGKTHYLYSETATCIGTREEVKGNNMKDQRKQIRTELHIWSID